MNNKNAWKTYTEEDINGLERLNASYRKFLSDCKTERECTKEIIRRAEEAGYIDLDTCINEGKTIKNGDKLYAVNMNKSVALFNIGKRPISEGMNIIGAHIDSPRLDVKQNPLYEEGGMAYLDTHYYGGIKKYQWAALPLAIHGVIVKKDGTCVEVCVGEEDDDPVFCITDLLIHLSSKQMEKTGAKVIEGEQLDVVVGSIPLSDSEKNCVKENVLNILKKEYDIEEEDFVSAELEVVPAGKARELGFDRGMIMSYGQDDRVCAFTSLEAQLNVENPERTTCCLLVDKEEIGSVGATGMRSHFFENTVSEIINLMEEYSELKVRRCLKNSYMLSTDVNAGYDPMFAEVFDSKNASYCGNGVVFSKYTGSRGKSGSNDANAEYIAKIRNVMDNNNVVYQTAELGKVDAGGGGTIAYILSLYGMEVIDCGVAVLNMHAPWEIVSKADVYETEKCYRAFLREMI
ncbi:MAG: aminopeptidase [Lachnospiraceae bacterium]|nr:aminopeptidase [Lachnoclostridium sp.]MDD7520801.1 aminopeptidase [Lachnoclostridium sp.]MDY2599403.1 aminopeptidase [Lachnospiraceae bacterium]